MNNRLFVLKLGGSVLTDKGSAVLRINCSVLRKIAASLREAFAQNDLKLIVVCGAGSAGHTLAHKYELRKGVCGSATKRRAAEQIRQNTFRLHRKVCRIMRENSLPAASFPTPQVITQKNGRISRFDIEALTKSLQTGQIPVIYGDMVDDEVLEMSVCSGDAIIAYLLKHLPVTDVLLATDVNGIYSSDPHRNVNAKLFSVLTEEDLRNEKISLGRSHNIDVTGGMLGKIKTILTAAESSRSLRRTLIFNGLVVANYSKIFDENSDIGTTVRHKTKKQKLPSIGPDLGE